MPAHPLAAASAVARNARHNPESRMPGTRAGAIQRRRPYWPAVCPDGVAAAPDDRCARWGGIEGGCHHHAAVPVGPTQAEAERRTAGIDDEVARCARLAPVRRVRAGRRPLLFMPRPRFKPGLPDPNQPDSRRRVAVHSNQMVAGGAGLA